MDGWVIDPKPTFPPDPAHPEELWGVEDPRITFVPELDRYVIAYTAFEWIWVILVIVVIFGAARLPQVGRNLGRGIKEFKEGVGASLLVRLVESGDRIGLSLHGQTFESFLDNCGLGVRQATAETPAFESSIRPEPDAAYHPGGGELCDGGRDRGCDAKGVWGVSGDGGVVIE